MMDKIPKKQGVELVLPVYTLLFGGIFPILLKSN
jgi:hypothetical protein